MQVGLPAVVGRAGSLPEVAGGAAVVVDAEDPEAMADDLQRVLGASA